MLFELLERVRGWLMPPPFWTRDLGAKGEYLARRRYHRLGYFCMDKNWRLGHGEIDLIMANRREAVFVEVKARTCSAEPMRIGDQLGREQEARLTRMARARAQFWPADTPWRFELALLQFRGGRCAKIQIARIL